MVSRAGKGVGCCCISVGSGGGGRVDMMVVGIGACAGTEDGKCGVGLRRLSR